MRGNSSRRTPVHRYPERTTIAERHIRVDLNNVDLRNALLRITAVCDDRGGLGCRDRRGQAPPRGSSGSGDDAQGRKATKKHPREKVKTQKGLPAAERRPLDFDARWKGEKCTGGRQHEVSDAPSTLPHHNSTLLLQAPVRRVSKELRTVSLKRVFCGPCSPMAEPVSTAPEPDGADERLMREALLEAELALSEGETPVGCVFADPSGAIVARGHNVTSATCNVRQDVGG